MILNQHRDRQVSIRSGCFALSSATRPPIDLSTQAAVQQATGIAALAARLGSRPIYIVLDFDGVLHADSAGPRKSELQSGWLDTLSLQARLAFDNADWANDQEPLGPRPGELFDRAGYLVGLLDRLPSAEIVISTSWRKSLNLVEFRRILPGSIAARVAGVLPNDDDRVDGTRERLFLHWLNDRKEDAPWVALDDQARHYSTGCSRLVQTPAAGLDQGAIAGVVVCLLGQV